MKRNPTVRDVARLARVAPISVSRVLHDDPSVSPSLRETVHAAIAQLGYRPNFAARELRSTRSRVIGVVMRDLSHDAYWATVRSIESYAELHGYSIFLGDSAGDPERERALLQRSLERRVAGVIVNLVDEVPDALVQISAQQIPIVSLGPQAIPTEGEIAYLPVDSRRGIAAAIDRLYALGHSHLALCTSGGSHLLRERTEVALQEAHTRRMRVSTISLDPNAEEAPSLIEAVSESDSATAVLALDYDLTPLVLAALADAEIAIPTDVSVVIVGHSQWLRAFRPSLAVVRGAIHPRGLFAIKRLLAFIEGGTAEKPPSFEMEFVDGCSVATAPTRVPSRNTAVRSPALVDGSAPAIDGATIAVCRANSGHAESVDETGSALLPRTIDQGAIDAGRQ
jgi:DNA-binding LacI/PurR family transcriptional regulator